MSKSSPRFVAPLRLEPRPSRLLWRVFLLIHLGGAALSLLVPVAWPLHLLIPVALLWHCRSRWRRMAIVPTLTWDGDGQWWLHSDDGDQPLQLAPDSVVWPWLVVLNFRRENSGRLALPLLPDSLAADTLRRLRAALRQRAC